MSVPSGTQGVAGLGWCPKAASTTAAAVEASETCATLNTVRCQALWCERPLTTSPSEWISTATDRPWYSSTAKVNSVEVAVPPARREVETTIGRSSPSTTSTTSTQNSGVRVSAASSLKPSRNSATSSATSPAVATPVR